MYPDNTLTPKEAARLCMLGTLAGGPLAHAELAGAVRAFTGAVLGPSLDVMASAAELLRLEGLIEQASETELHITAAGRAALHELLQAPVRDNGGEFNRLITALKIRYLHLLAPAERLEQIDVLLDAAEAESARLDALAAGEGESDAFRAWITHEKHALSERAAWLEQLRGSV
ncbi:MAG: hypothetical protein ACYYKD_10100 [Rhodospirillales bacterium]